MIVASGDCTITATGEALSIISKNSFDSHKVEIKFDSINLIKPLFVGDRVKINDMLIKIDIITDTMITGHTIQMENK
tara:strand:+ start:17 stop:247 length:231 start_codon:yes stop_codon:yes gene_type:complete